MIEIDRQQMSRDDPANNCQSLRSNNQSCSQSRKMSIGIAVDSLTKPKCGPTGELKVFIRNAKKVTPNGENFMGEMDRKQEVQVSGIGNRNETERGNGSSWIATRSLETSTLAKSSSVIVKKASSLPAIGITSNKHNLIHDQTKTSLNHVSSNGTLLDSDDGKQIKIDILKGNEKDETDGRVGELSYAVAQEIAFAGKGVPWDKLNVPDHRSKEILRLKLWETLGTVASPNRQSANSQSVEVGGIEIKQECTHKDDAPFKPRQGSDTIETDSESPVQPVIRPVTCSLARKRAPARVHLKNLQVKKSSGDKGKYQEKNGTCYKENGLGIQSNAGSAGLMMLSRNSDIKSNGNKTTETVLPAKDVGDIDQAECIGKKPSPAGTKNDGKLTGTLIMDALNSSGRKYHLGDIKGPASPVNVDEQKPFHGQSPQNNASPCSDFRSPMSNMKIVVQSPPVSSLPQVNEMEHQIDGPGPASRDFFAPETFGFINNRTKRGDNSGSIFRTEASDDNASLSTPVQPMERRDEENGLFSFGRGESDGVEEETSPKRGCAEDIDSTPEISFVEKKMLFWMKQFHRDKDIDCSEFTLRLDSPKSDADDDGMSKGRSEENQEDELARAVTLFASLLERVNSKITSATKKRCSNLLTAAAEEIHLKLQNVESQMQTDIWKLTSLSKSRRACLEARFKEQQEHLKLMHEKFKEDIDRHLQEYKSTVVGLQAQEIEFRGAIKRQRAMHQELLLQVEEVVENHLIDVQRRITSVDRLGRDRLQQLRFAIVQCFK
ncbi:hypothetical protein Ancab_039231 [Ancistrocladus abbreviatus]